MLIVDTNKDKTVLDNLDAIELDLMTNSEYAINYLTEQGVDIDEEINFAEKKIKNLLFLAKGKAKKANKLRLIQTAMDRIIEVINENTQIASDKLISMLQEKNPSLQYRNLNKWSDDEIRDVLSDIDVLELLDKLENKE